MHDAPSDPNLRAVCATRTQLGEGPVWCPDTGMVYWVDTYRFGVHAWQAEDGAHRRWAMAEPTVGLALTDRPGWLLLVLATRVVLWHPATKAQEMLGAALGTERPGQRFNEARIDPQGRLWTGTMAERIATDGSHGEPGEQQGVLYRVDADGTRTVMAADLTVPNTLCWSPAGDTLTFGDSDAKTLWRYAYHKDGTLGGRQDFYRHDGQGQPDGSAMDAEGHVWTCLNGGSEVVRLDPTGAVVQRVALPVSQPTSCIFGGTDLRTLYITTAQDGLADEAEPLAGQLLALETPVAGVSPMRFQTGC